MNKLLKPALSMVAVGLLCVGQAQATPITGDLGFSGAATFNATSLATAHELIPGLPSWGQLREASSVCLLVAPLPWPRRGFLIHQRQPSASGALAASRLTWPPRLSILKIATCL